MNNQKNAGFDDRVVGSGIVGLFPHGFKSRCMASFLILFVCFLHFLFLFSPTVFHMHPYFGTVRSLE